MEKVILLSAALLVSGCASPPGIDVAGTGRLPNPPGHMLQLSGSGDPVLTERIMTALTARGFKVADPADYLVQIVGSDIPGKAGLYLPEALPDASGQRAWLAPPSRRKALQTRRITVTLTDVDSGSEVYRASAYERYREGKSEGSDALIDAVVGQISEQAISPAAGREAAAR